MTRAKFENINDELFQKTIAPIDRALEAAGWDRTEIDEVLLIGGSTRIPKIQKMVREYFGEVTVS